MGGMLLQSLVVHPEVTKRRLQEAAKKRSIDHDPSPSAAP
jgi:hypothetical protein